MSKESFKLFAKNHPELAEKVLKDNVSWQKLYELYEIYGAESTIWNNYLERNLPAVTSQATSLSSFKDLYNTIKNIDLDSVQQGVNNLQKTIGLLQEIGLGTRSTPTETYEQRPIYKSFED